MATAQVVERSVTDNNNSPIQDYVHPDDQTQPAFVSEHLQILGVTLDKKLAFKEHISLQLEKGLQNESSTEKITSLSPVRNYQKALQGMPAEGDSLSWDSLSRTTPKPWGWSLRKRTGALPTQIELPIIGGRKFSS